MKLTPISETVEQIFDNIVKSSSNKLDFYHLKQFDNNSIVKTPYILFMCKQSESTKSGFLLVDLFSSNKSTYTSLESEKPNMETVLFPRIQHNNFGNYTLFSSTPFSTSNLVKRFAVFVDSAALIFETVVLV